MLMSGGDVQLRPIFLDVHIVNDNALIHPPLIGIDLVHLTKESSCSSE